MRKLLMPLIALVAFAPVCAVAQSYPTRTVEIVVPFPAGANSDIASRPLAEALSKVLGQPVVVANKDGAAGTIGTTAVASAQPDGYTLGFSAMGVVTAQPHLRDKLRYDASAFDYICQVTDVFVVASVSKESPHKTFKDLVAYARANPDKLNYGHPGPGTVPNLLMLQLATDHGVKLNAVPFRGDALGFNALLGNHIDVLLSADATVAGKNVQPVAVFGDERLTQFPDMPTTKELGLGTGFGTPNGLFAPKGLPPEVLARLRAACATAMKSDAMTETMKKARQNMRYLDGDAFAARVKRDSDSIGSLINKIGRPKN
ncbi:MAG: Bug family tripartite tricarboxylate transporter substrate binding protein [Pseudorhodoplanes sp.]|uniref:Bug family tripartite tricarboxylate transporter substrate binding protein n=1 Tax=Pseudorhodoplanes sp. TaxID=1934341 RepID=UPI003D0C25C5